MNVQTPTADALRAQVHAMWASVADRWAEHADHVDERAAAVTAALLDRSAPRPGERVLELACGAGGLGIAAAQRVGAGGEVVVSDVVADMAANAGARAASRGLTNVRTATLDLEQIDQPDESYDVVLCRDGMMFAVEAERAAGEIRRVLRRGGRVALAVWGPRERNPWLGLVFDAVSDETGLPVPPPGVPGPFSLSDATRLRGLLSDAGLDGVVVEEMPTPLRSPSFEDWWARTSQIAGPLARVLGNMAEETKKAITERLRAAARPYTTAAGLELPGVNLLASAHR